MLCGISRNTFTLGTSGEDSHKLSARRHANSNVTTGATVTAIAEGPKIQAKGDVQSNLFIFRQDNCVTNWLCTFEFLFETEASGGLKLQIGPAAELQTLKYWGSPTLKLTEAIQRSDLKHSKSKSDQWGTETETLKPSQTYTRFELDKVMILIDSDTAFSPRVLRHIEAFESTKLSPEPYHCELLNFVHPKMWTASTWNAFPQRIFFAMLEAQLWVWISCDGATLLQSLGGDCLCGNPNLVTGDTRAFSTWNFVIETAN